jgi:hypothetical protein
MDRILTSDRVMEIFAECLQEENHESRNQIKVEGIVTTAFFDLDILKNHTTEIVKMLNELPANFNINTGGGWSFLMACKDKNGIQWTGSHDVMEKLFMLGIAINKVKYLLPKSHWHMFYGGMPYLTINT